MSTRYAKLNLETETYEDYELYTPFTPDSLTSYIQRLPFFDLSDIVIYEDESVRAVAGYWDYDKLMKFTMMGYNTRWKIMRLITSLMGFFTSMPNMPGVGEQMTNCYLILLGFRASLPADQLLGYMVNRTRSRGVNMVSIPLDKDSHIVKLLSKFRHGEGSFNWYMRTNKGLPLPDISSRALYVDPIDV